MADKQAADYVSRILSGMAENMAGLTGAEIEAVYHIKKTEKLLFHQKEQNTNRKDGQQMDNPAVTVTAKDIPGFPGAVAYTIVGLSAELVQREINRLFNQVETHKQNACAEFDNPEQMSNGSYCSRGYTFIQL